MIQLSINLKSAYNNSKTTKDILYKGSDFMIKQIAWDTFKNTGDINSFLELKQIENIENS